VALPGILFVAAFSIAVPAILWVPLYQFLFIGYWYWQTLWFHAELPNLGRTLLAPIGVYALGGIYGYLDSDPRHPPQLSPTPAEGVASIVLLVGTAALVLVVLERYLIWRQARQ
jgi:ABC-2 type transport system permease protein